MGWEVGKELGGRNAGRELELNAACKVAAPQTYRLPGRSVSRPRILEVGSREGECRLPSEDMGKVSFPYTFSAACMDIFKAVRLRDLSTARQRPESCHS